MQAAELNPGFRRVAEASATIDARVDLVWHVLLDFAQYPEWNPFVVRVEAPPETVVGSALLLHVQMPGGSRLRSAEQVQLLESPDGVGTARFVYRYTSLLGRLGLMTSSRWQGLKVLEDGRTLYETREAFGGAFSSLMPLSQVQRGLDLSAQALKKHCEKLSPSSASRVS